MAFTSRDTTLDALAAQARTHPPLPPDQVGQLLREARDQPHGAAAARLVEHHLDLVLQSALSRPRSLLEVGDLFQEATVAVATAVEQYAARGRNPQGLRAYVEKVIALHLDAAEALETEARQTAEAFVRASQEYQGVEVELRLRLGRPATTLELAAALEWPQERVVLVGEMLVEARQRHDTELAAYIGNLDEDDEEGAD